MKKSYSFILSLMTLFGNVIFHSKTNSAYHPTAHRPIGGMTITSKGCKPVYKPLHPEKLKARKEKHWDYVTKLRAQGIHWTPFGLFWMTRELADQHK